MKQHTYTEAQICFLINNVKDRSYAEMRDLFNREFELSLTPGQIAGTIKRYGLKNGRDMRIKPGNVPFNKGMKGIRLSVATEFKPGHRPANYRPVGSERINADGYTEVKVADPKKWRMKHCLIYEEHYGPISKGSVIIFGDGNRANFDPDNLICLTRSELVRMNQNGLIQNDAELTRAGVVIANIAIRIANRKKAR